ncbi:MAG: ABC transporter substrate-binding protein [Saprospiraceae bacterium]|nr:ABC transporter substrate-binding protein [Saprospiraceae bacterium]
MQNALNLLWRSLKNFKYLFLLAFIFIACKNNDKPIRTNVFHYNQTNYISTLDPAFSKSQNNIWVIDHIFNQLVDLDNSLKLQPEIAKSWSISKDGLIYRFELRTDIKFHSNPCFQNAMPRILNAQDLVFSFNRLLDPNVNSPGSWIFSDKVDSINAFQAINDSVFEIKLRTPFAPLLNLLTMQYCSVMPKEAALYYGKDLNKNPVGTGPFMLKKWLGRKGMFLNKNPHYFISASPELEGIRISFIEDRNTAYLEFLKDEIDFFSGLQASFALQLVTKDGFLRPDKEKQLKLMKGDYLNTEYIGINLDLVTRDHPLHDKRVRQALNYSIDRQKLIQVLKFGIGTPAHAGFVPKGLPGFDSSLVKGYSYNPQKARTLLIEAGYESKDSFPELVIYTNKDYVDIITFVAKQWEEIGVPVRIDLVETATLREKMRQSEIILFRASWVADYPDEESFLNVFYSKNPAPPNYTRFKNKKYDALYELSIKETNAVNRKGLYQKMDSIIIDEAPVIFLFYDQTAWFVQNHIHHLQTNSINLLKLESVIDSF